MKKIAKPSAVVFAFVLSGCGGGGSGPGSNGAIGTQPTTPTALSHSIQLGPIVGAAVTIYRSDCKSSVYQTTTDENGNYTVNIAELKSTLGTNMPEMLCVEGVGGKDVDPNDDGIRDANEVISVQGKIRGFVKTNDLLSASGTRINLFGSAIADLLSLTDDVTLARVEQFAEQLGVPDLDKDGKITIADVTRYEMGTKTNGEEALRALYLRSIHEGNNSDRSFFIESTDTSIAAVRPTHLANGDGTLQITLNKYSRDGIIYYGTTLQNQLANVYARPFTAKPNEIIFVQECRGTTCYAMQAIQVNSAGNKLVEYTDTGGVDLSLYYANVQTKKDLLAKMEDAKKLVDQANFQIEKNKQDISSLQNEVARLDTENSEIDNEIRRLQAGG